MFSIAIMQLIGAICTETVNMIQICLVSTNTEIIASLLAFKVIAEVDDYYAKSLRNNFPRALQQKGRLDFYKLGRDNHDPLDINKNWLSWGLKWIYCTLQIFYDSVYYYFMPYLILPMTFIL